MDEYEYDDNGDLFMVCTRKEAQRDLLSYYFTAKPCRHGHVRLRRTDTCLCLGCREEQKETAKRRRRLAREGWHVRPDGEGWITV